MKLAQLICRVSTLGLFYFLVFSCNEIDNPVDTEEMPDCFFAIEQQGPFYRPILHPDEGFVSYYYTPISKVEYPHGPECPVSYIMPQEKSGYWKMDQDGGSFEKLIDVQLYGESWSPDGKWLAFGAGNLFKMPYIDGVLNVNMIKQLTQTGWNHHAVWSPNGEWIALNRSLDDNYGPSGIYIMRNDGRGKKHLGRGHNPQWHPYGEFLVATLNDDGDHFFLFIDPFNPKKSDYYKKIKREPNASSLRYSYSPNGEYLAMILERQELGSDLWVADENGQNAKRITTKGAERDFTWLDNRHVLFVTRYSDGGWNTNSGTFFKIDIHTGEKTQITRLLHEENSILP